MSRLFGSGKNVVAGGTVVKVVIDSSTQKISNPVSAKECGNWKISTFNMIGGKEWLVDTASASSTSLKFIATAGTINTGTVSIINVAQKIASSESDTYKFDLTLPHSLPAFGKILLKLPSSPASITIPSTAPVASSCFTYRTGTAAKTQQFCSVQNANTEVQITFQNGFSVSAGNQQISIELQGFRNPRTTQ
jgi:hypothetical protein